MTPLLALLLAAASASPPPAVTLRAPPPLAKDVNAYPRIAAPDTEAARRINAALVKLDAKARAAIADCRSGAPDRFDWSRQVDTPMRGPEFVSYLVTDDVDCGGAHPNSGHSAIVYDLADGRPVDWTRLLPPALTGKLDLAEGEDQVKVVTLASARLTQLYRKLYDHGSPDPQDDKECRDAVATEGDGGPIPMLAWLDAKAGGLALQFDFAHVEEACSEQVVIPVETLAREGASPRLLAALRAAHAAAVPPPHRP